MSAESARRWPLWTRVLVGVFAAIGVFYIAMLVLYHPWALAFRNRTDHAEGAKIVYHEVSPRQ